MRNDLPPNVLNLAFVEHLYSEYLRDPNSVPPDWREYFTTTSPQVPEAARLGPSFKPRGLFAGAGNGSLAPREVEVAALQERVDQLIRAYRIRGHFNANIDPLGAVKESPPDLDPAFHGLTEADLDRVVSTDAMPGAGQRTVREIIAVLHNTYCRSIGVEYMHIDDLSIRSWLQERMESTENRLELTRKEQLRILVRLTDAVVFEDFVQKNYVGAKSFSLEGAESLIPLLDLAIEKAGDQGMVEIVLAMAHRGRLNVLANIMGKHPQDIFREFEDVDTELFIGRGDVKYHLGYSTDWRTVSSQDVHLSLCFNPSHLEYVNPVAMGRMRAKQDRVGGVRGQRTMVLMIHGDASFAGEGIVQETLNLSGLPAYETGGSLHVIINNQIGFTTSPPETRTSHYATDVAKMLQSPIFHVNGEDPEAVAQVVRLAMDFRRTFKRDVVIDMYCFRRRGHNEGDEPSFTQPLMYDTIRKRKSVREAYLEQLLKLGGLTSEEAERIAERRQRNLEKAIAVARSDDYKPNIQAFKGLWRGYVGGPESRVEDVETGVNTDTLSELLTQLTRLPDDFHLHPKLVRWMAQRKEMAARQRPLDWSTAETLAFASLAAEGYRVRLTGQDSERGTFSQRHAVLHDVQDGHTYVPLKHLTESQAPVEIYNSPLSEAGVLGFEYGYSLDYPDGLVAWEAQFGDFVNVAQVIIDQFISSAEEKWNRLSGIVMLLPHGFEGQGPEHASARLERFLTLAAEDNMQIVIPSTPAQYFHCLRRQVLRRWRKPLVVMTPKSLLRHPAVTSTLDDCAAGTFQRVLPDPQVGELPKPKRIIVCSGKIYYELSQKREEWGQRETALIRLEQLYPFPTEALQAAFEAYAGKTAITWVQEEPENMGAWPFLRRTFGEELLGRRLTGVTRPESSSPATGSANTHKIEQELLLKKAFGLA